MDDEPHTGDKDGPRLSLENMEKWLKALTAIVTAVLAILVAAFAVGVWWANLLGYELRVTKLEANLKSLEDGINHFKMNIGQLGDPSYETEVTSSPATTPGVPGGSRCERGNVVTGARYDGEGKRMWIQCASVNRAVWNPFAAKQAQK